MASPQAGWIKLHRKLLDAPYYRDGDHIRLWLHILLRANHEPTEILLDGVTRMIMPGQFVTSRKVLSQELLISDSKAERVLKYFKTEQQIEQESHSKYRIITVVKWEEYQHSEQQDEQQMNSNRTATEQQLNTDKKVKKEKNNTFRPSDFETFWILYPKRRGRKAGKTECLEWYKAHIKNGDGALLLEAVKNYSASKEAKDGFSRDPIRFLKKDFWRDFIGQNEGTDESYFYTGE